MLVYVCICQPWAVVSNESSESNFTLRSDSQGNIQYIIHFFRTPVPYDPKQGRKHMCTENDVQFTNFKHEQIN